MTPAEGSDLDGVCPTPRPGSWSGGWSPIHRSSGFALDLCLFKRDLSEVLFLGCLYRIRRGENLMVVSCYQSVDYEGEN